MTFEKLSGTGNDFLFVTFPSPHVPKKLQEIRELAKKTCDRSHLGADGLALWQPPSSLAIINSDGSVAGTCGNALRAFGFLLLKEGRWDGASPLPVRRLQGIEAEGAAPDELEFLSSGSVFATLLEGRGNGDRGGIVKVDMGKEIEVRPLPPDTLRVKASHAGINIDLEFHSFVRLANPHWFVFSNSFANFSKQDFERFGEACQSEPFRTLFHLPVSNIGMAWADEKSPNTFHLVVYERGAGFTLCCGSGAVAARAALERAGKAPSTDEDIYFVMPGGKIAIGKNKETRTLAGDVEYLGRFE